MNEAKQEKGGIGKGFFLGISLGVVQAIAAVGIGEIVNKLSVLIFEVFFFGLIQLVYMVPLYLFLRKREPATATGLVIAAGLVALANVTCAGVIH